MAILTIVIGMIFVLLLFSLLATTVMELIAAFFRLRGKNLTNALRNMLASCDKDQTVLKEFQKNSLYKHLTQQYGGKSVDAPSYMAGDTFQSILFDVILGKEAGVDKLKEKIDQLPDEDLRNVLNQLLRDSNHELDDFKVRIEKWYGNVMDRAGGWYKRRIQKILIGIGLVIALIFNADTISIYERLESNPATTAQVAALAENFINANDEGLVTTNEMEFNEQLDKLRGLINEEVESIRSPLGLGWDNVDVSKFGPYDWLTKVLGFLVTALAVSLGAPFWFDLLRKIVNIRSSGEKP